MTNLTMRGNASQGQKPAKTGHLKMVSDVRLTTRPRLAATTGQNRPVSKRCHRPDVACTTVSDGRKPPATHGRGPRLILTRTALSTKAKTFFMAEGRDQC